MARGEHVLKTRFRDPKDIVTDIKTHVNTLYFNSLVKRLFYLYSKCNFLYTFTLVLKRRIEQLIVGHLGHPRQLNPNRNCKCGKNT